MPGVTNIASSEPPTVADSIYHRQLKSRLKSLGRVLINSAHVRFGLGMRHTRRPSSKALVVSKRDMHDQLAFNGVAGNVSLA
jgi:hypothetical protein